jgi:phosphogluconate dehydratase
MVTVDAIAGTITVETDDDFDARPAATADLSANDYGTGRELFRMFRQTVGSPEAGASPLV